MSTAIPAPLPSDLPTAPLPPEAVEAMASLESRLAAPMSEADVAAHEAASYVRRPVDRVAVIAEAIGLLESGEVSAPASVGDPLALFESLKASADGTGPRGFAAFKMAQRIVASKADSFVRPTLEVTKAVTRYEVARDRKAELEAKPTREWSEREFDAFVDCERVMAKSAEVLTAAGQLHLVQAVA
ncbi:hypothetical protein [Streptomyces sp. NPDC059786]|uniref:hypothetical protein n=1 Tax=Streptomyces sp. NPDC059786 TaxID=3346946 RepID=UPI00365F3023